MGVLLALMAVLAVGAGATSCTDDGPSTTAASGSVPATTTGPDVTDLSGAPGSDTGGVAAGPAPSVLPSPTTRPGSGPSAATCATLAETLPLSDLVPRDGDSWPDERQRVAADARRNAALHDQAAAGAPDALREPIETLAAFERWAADTVQGASSALAARAAIDAYPAQGEVGAASAEVDRWRTTTCS